MLDKLDLPIGFSLQEDDHVVTLMHESEMVDRFSATGATQESIKNCALKHLKEKH